jgi:hypothetical protein
MGLISKAFEKLPRWLQFILMALGIGMCIYGVAHHGWTYLLRVIFSPDL